MGIVLALASVTALAGVGVWQVQENSYVPQASAATCNEILPAEDMDIHNITWWPAAGGNLNGGVRFWPSLSWDNPVAGDWLCWLYDNPTFIVVWQGTFFQPSQTVVVQLKNCDNNDGWVDVFVDGVFEFSYNSFHAAFTDVRLIGTGFANAAHQVELQTKFSGGDVSVDYCAGGAGASDNDPTTWGSIKALYR